jgi:hypothetical protein
MNAAETIQAAITALEGLQDDSTPGPWRIVRDSLQGSRRDYDPLLEAGDYAASGETFNNPADPRLIVTLYRAIDPILTILRHALARAESKIATGGNARSVWSHEIDAENLASAVLGADS